MPTISFNLWIITQPNHFHLHMWSTRNFQFNTLQFSKDYLREKKMQSITKGAKVDLLSVSTKSLTTNACSGWKRPAGRVMDPWTEEESYCHCKDPQEEREEHYLSFDWNELSKAVSLCRPSIELVNNDLNQCVQNLLRLRIYICWVQDLSSISFKNIDHDLRLHRTDLQTSWFDGSVKLSWFVHVSGDRGRWSKVRRKWGFRWSKKWRIRRNQEALGKRNTIQKLKTECYSIKLQSVK